MNDYTESIAWSLYVECREDKHTIEWLVEEYLSDKSTDHINQMYIDRYFGCEDYDVGE